MGLVPALMLSSIERLEAAKDALMREHQSCTEFEGCPATNSNYFAQ